jgi:bacillithiol biosynthesis deacetylase BshB1
MVFFFNSPENQLAIIKVIRKYQPDIVLCNAIYDRHPDHGKGSSLVSDACFYSGLIKIESELDGQKQSAWRPKQVYHYIQDRYIKPDFIVDISAHIEKKMESIMAFSSQFYNVNSPEPHTPISSKQFIETLRSRAAELGRIIGSEYGEGFTCERIAGVKNLNDLI